MFEVWVVIPKSPLNTSDPQDKRIIWNCVTYTLTVRGLHLLLQRSGDVAFVQANGKTSLGFHYSFLEDIPRQRCILISRSKILFIDFSLCQLFCTADGRRVDDENASSCRSLLLFALVPAS